MRGYVRHLCFVLSACLMASCLSPREDLSIRYFGVDAPRATTTDAREPALDLRVRNASSADHLGERFVWTHSGEFGFDEQRRWAERPLAYVERALDIVLFESGLARRSEASNAWTLDLRLEAFEHVFDDSGEYARVVLRAELSDAAGVGVIARAFSTDSPVEQATGPAIAAAFSAALNGSVARLAVAIGDAVND